MSWIIRTAAGAAIALSCGAAANAGDAAGPWSASPWYVSVSGGGYFRQDNTIAAQFDQTDDPSVTATGTARTSYATGFMVNGAVGYRVNSNIRVEGEVGVIDYNASVTHPVTSNENFPELNGQPFSRQSGADFTRVTGTANAFYDLGPMNSAFRPYVGGGLGFSIDTQSIGHFANSSGELFDLVQPRQSSVEGIGFAEAGITIAVSRRLSIVPAYRFVRVLNSGLDVAHVGKVGIRYAF